MGLVARKRNVMKGDDNGESFNFAKKNCGFFLGFLVREFCRLCRILMDSSGAV